MSAYQAWRDELVAIAIMIHGSLETFLPRVKFVKCDRPASSREFSLGTEAVRALMSDETRRWDLRQDISLDGDTSREISMINRRICRRWRLRQREFMFSRAANFALGESMQQVSLSRLPRSFFPFLVDSAARGCLSSQVS